MADPTPDTLSEDQLRELRDDLRRLGEELTVQLESSREASRPVDLDEPIGRLSRVDAMQQQKMVAANRSAAQRRRRQVETAIRRFDEGEFGDCAGCGEPIGYPRLKARPESPLCVGCQKSREHAAG